MTEYETHSTFSDYYFTYLRVAGVPPLNSYKDSTVEYLQTTIGDWFSNAENEIWLGDNFARRRVFWF